ncbi:porphobilinogen deaminase, dipyromethane cofactor binding domain-containing protein [Mycena amicta]|nr:porphobilinogen deaminase, dipyromethane cofactor binding domain-containing protein [Mycena amicta]
MAPRTFTLASRASQLAQIQTNITVATLEGTLPTQALYTLNSAEGKAFWTKDLEVALLDGSVDMLVHSFKDVPTTLPDGCVIGAVLEREDPVDSFVVKKGKEWKALDDLPDGSVVGTSSVRRIAQLKRNFPGLKFMDCEPLAVEVRADDVEALALCEKITHKPTLLRCSAERACLRVLEGGCSVPSRYGELEMTGCRTLTQKVASKEDAERVGKELAKLLVDGGAAEILQAINKDREQRAKEASA